MKLFLISICLVLFLGCKAEKSKEDTNVVHVNALNDNNYFGPDSLLLKTYDSDNGYQVKLRGSASQDIYSISIKRDGQKEVLFSTAEHWYPASHTSIEWDNEDFIFIRQGCGTNCWIGKLLSIKDNSITEFPQYVYTDSINNIAVVYDEKFKIIDFKNNNETIIDIEICNKVMQAYYAIDSVYIESNHITIDYLTPDCETLDKRKIKMNSN